MLVDWVDADQPVSIFDDLTPRTHAAIMEGCKRREHRSVQRDVALAWRVANFWRAAQGKDFRDLGHYLNELNGSKRQQSAEDVVSIFVALKAKGRDVNITERKRDAG